MTLRIPYRSVRAIRPVPSLFGRMERPRPYINVTIIGPGGTAYQKALLDSGADDTVFPEPIATTIGIDLSNAPWGTVIGMGGGSGLLRFAQVTLRIAVRQERREWRAWVGFTTAPLQNALLGFAGFLQYFTATFHGDREEVELTVNGLYPGT